MTQIRLGQSLEQKWLQNFLVFHVDTFFKAVSALQTNLLAAPTCPKRSQKNAEDVILVLAYHWHSKHMLFATPHQTKL